MLKDLFVNSVILVAVLSLGSQVFRERPLTYPNTLFEKIIAGILTGSLGCLLIVYGVRVNSKVILDLRDIAIIIASVYAGLLSSIISGVVIGLFRVLYFGTSTTSMSALLIALIVSLVCGLISKTHISRKKKWIYSVSFSLIIDSIGFILFLKNEEKLISALAYYWVSTLLISSLIYFYTKYLLQSGELYRRYRDELRKDFLTGLNNVRQFDIILNEITKGLKVNGYESISLLYLDIDFFKKVNDAYGHAAGDIVLKEFSKLLIATLGNDDLIFRNGGEEFSAILFDCSAANAIKEAEKIRTAVENNKFKIAKGKKINITVSIGISSYPDVTTDMDKMLEEADNALYTAKRTGRNKVVVHGYESEAVAIR